MRELWKTHAKTAALVAVLSMVLGLVVVPAVASTQARWIGVKRVQMDTRFIWGDRHQIRGFLPTGSERPGCLTTLVESNFAKPGQTLYCGVRYRDGEPGVYVAVFSLEEFPPELSIFISVYQPGATYGQPIPCADVPDVCD